MDSNNENTIKGFKGFDSSLRCRGFQYETGKTYRLPDGEKAVLCNRGFHAIHEDASPLSVFDYYSPADENSIPARYCQVEVGGQTEKREEKVAGTQITIGAEIGIPGLVKAHVEWVRRRMKDDDEHKDTGFRSAATNTGDYSAATNTGDYSAATNTGDRSAATNTGHQSAATNTGDYSAATNTGFRSAATNTGDQSAATNTGDCSAATNTGDYSAATNTGFRSAATNTGDYSAATNTGHQSAATNTGDYSAATNTGDRSAATNTGNYSAASVGGKESVAIVTGKDSKAQGALGCWLVLTERGDWDGETYPIIGMRCVKVDGETIKPDTWYLLKDGEVTEWIDDTENELP